MNKKEGKGKNTKPKNNNTTSNNLLKLPKKITNKNRKKYESFNVVSETGDSIYSPQYEEFATLDGGQVFVLEIAIEELVNRIIDQRLGSSINNKRNEH